VLCHGFTGSRSEVQECLDLGLFIGITGWVCDERRGLELRELLPAIPAKRLLLETDAPDMPLNGFQGQPNRPEQAARVFEALCELRPESPAAIEEGIMHNTLALFSLPPASVW
jgi:TatD DNase family protein